MKAQASLEQLLVIAIALAFIAATVYLAGSYAAEALRISQAEDAVGRLGAAADYVYSMGPNTKEYVDVYLPEGITWMNVSGKRLVLRLGIAGGSTDIFANTRAELIGALPHTGGKQKILVQYLESGKVLIGEAGLSCEPALITRVLNVSDGGSDTINITNGADFDVTGLRANFSGPAAALAALGPLQDTLGVGQGAELAVNYDIPGNQPSGVYGGLIIIESGNNGACAVDLNININGAVSCSGLCSSAGYLSGTCRTAPAECVANGEDYVSADDYACVSGPARCCCGPTQDEMGPLATDLSTSPSNATATDNVTIGAVCNDSGTGGSYIASAQVRVDSGAWLPMDASGSFLSSPVEAVERDVGTLVNGQHIAWVQCSDSAGNAGPIAYYYFNVSMADTIGPIVTFMNHTAYPTSLSNISMDGIGTDAYTGNHDINVCKVKVDDGAWTDAGASDGSYDQPTEAFGYNIGQLGVGYHTIYVQCIDDLDNVGGTYNMSFGVVSVDLMLVLDRSGSMAWNVTNITNRAQVSTTNTGFTKLKNMTVDVKNGDLANISVEVWASTSGCTASYEVRINGNAVASGNRTSISAGTVTNYSVDVSSYSPPFTMDLYMKRSAGASCTAYGRYFTIQQSPIKMSAAKASAKIFVDIVSDTTKAGLASYSTSSSLDRQLALMSSGNKDTLKSSIDSLSANGGTCIECGLETAADELTSARGRADSTRVMVLLTDGVSTYGDSVAGAVYARERNITVYTIGLGNDVDDTELTNIAMLTNGAYYFAPDAETLTEIFRDIGR